MTAAALSLQKLKQAHWSEVYAILGLQDGINPPPGWVAWRKPSPALPIDDAIYALTKRSRSPTLQHRDKIGFSCPYYWARQATAKAVTLANMEEVETVEAFGPRATSIRDLELQASTCLGGLFAVRDQIAGCDIYAEPAPAARRVNIDRSSEWRIKGSVTYGILDLVGPLQNLISLCASTLTDLENNRTKKDVWTRAFVLHLGQYWHALTDKSPSTSDDSQFIDFVSEAFRSVCFEKQNFNRPKNYAHDLNRDVSEDEGFARYSILVPDPSFQPTEPEAAEARALLKDERRRRIAAQIKADADELLLLGASPEDINRILDLSAPRVRKT